jgi:hypothetical protein
LRMRSRAAKVSLMESADNVCECLAWRSRQQFLIASPATIWGTPAPRSNNFCYFCILFFKVLAGLTRLPWTITAVILATIRADCEPMDLLHMTQSRYFRRFFHFSVISMGSRNGQFNALNSLKILLSVFMISSANSCHPFYLLYFSSLRYGPYVSQVRVFFCSLAENIHINVLKFLYL